MFREVRGGRLESFLAGIGPYSVYPRTSAAEGNQVVNLSGSWHRLPAYKARLRVALQMRTPTCQHRGVGHPIAVAVTEGLMDLAAERLGLDPAEIRRRNLLADDACPHTAPSGLRFERLSLRASFEMLLARMDYDRLRREQAEARGRGMLRGIGLACFVELSNPGPAFYGVGGAPISAQDGCGIRLDSGGTVTASISVTEQGQGTEAVIAQVVAHELSVPIEQVRVVTGDIERAPYGDGTWASRGAGIGGQAALLASRALKANILALAAVVLQARPKALDIRGGEVTDLDGTARMSLKDVGRIGYVRGDTLPPELPARVDGGAPRHAARLPLRLRQRRAGKPGGVRSRHRVRDIAAPLGRGGLRPVINPLLVDEQIRGGVVQGIGAALPEECAYDEHSQTLSGTMADYLVPMADGMPGIAVSHVETPTATSMLGAKGAGEAGTAGAPAAVMNAINDAIRPLGGRIAQQPATPERILRALARHLT